MRMFREVEVENRAEETPYQHAVQTMGKEAVDRVCGRTVDPETGYIGQNTLGDDFGPEVRCCRCGGRGMWKPPRQEESPLCLRCFDEWFDSKILDKHRSPQGRITDKRWKAAFNEFLQTKPKETDIEAHNQRIKSGDRIIHTLFPQFFS